MSTEDKDRIIDEELRPEWEAIRRVVIAETFAGKLRPVETYGIVARVAYLGLKRGQQLERERVCRLIRNELPTPFDSFGQPTIYTSQDFRDAVNAVRRVLNDIEGTK